MQNLMNLFNVSLRQSERRKRSDRRRVTLHAQDYLFTSHMIGGVDPKQIGSLIVTDLELTILRNVDPFSAQTGFVFQDGDNQVCRFPLKTERLHPVTVGLVVNI